jgi:hypothetical protein
MIHGKVSSTPAPAFLAGGGEMGALMRAHDWSATLGPVEAWPQALRQALGICLNAQHPIGIYWGEQRRLLYNDAWRRLIGEKHPGALGAPAGEVFPEAWPSIEPALTGVFATGVAAGSAEDLLPQRLDGQLEDRWFDFSLNPIIGDEGRVEGVLSIGIEITTRILAERREAFRIELDERLCGLKDPREIIDTAAELLGQHLAADRVGYAEMDGSDFMFLIEDDWTNGRMPSLRGRRRLDEFGPERIISLRAGRALAFEKGPAEPATADAGIVPIQVPIRAGLTVPLVRGGAFCRRALRPLPRAPPLDRRRHGACPGGGRGHLERRGAGAGGNGPRGDRGPAPGAHRQPAPRNHLPDRHGPGRQRAALPLRLREP